ncbi:MAG: hypothetical protein L0Y76_11615, partial [Ignavibacteria bacterium]|nr:hypothetical protein [Ignavibacteria bacterium]
DEGEFTPAAAMTYASSITTQTSGYVFTGNVNQEIIGIQIVTSGNSNPLEVSQFTVNANGTTDINDINLANAKIFYTAGSSVFDTLTLFGSAAPSLTDFVISGSQTLTEGTNYFWLTYDISPAALDGNQIDGECNNILISSVNRTPSVTAPAGFKTVAGLMAGDYYVGQGQSLPNFVTITQAFYNVERRGVTGPVNFILTNPVSVPYNVANGETMPLTFRQIPGAGTTNTVTIKPNSGTQSLIADNVSSSVIKFAGADYIIIEGSNNGTNSRDITITNNSASSNTAAIWFSSLGTGQGATYNTIKNCNISTGSNTASTYGVLAGGTTFGFTGADNDNLTIENNYITKSYYGIYLNGNSNTSDNGRITGNTIGATFGSTADYVNFYGIYLAYNTNAIVSQNTVRNMISNVPDKRGIYIGTGTLSSHITRNNINGIHYTGVDGYGVVGLYINTGSAASNDTISNNIIYDIKADGYNATGSPDNPYGMMIDGITGRVAVLYNTVNLYGDISNGSSTYTTFPAAMCINTTSNTLDIRNNAFINSMTKSASALTKCYAIYSFSNSSVYTLINYNDYYASGTQGVLGYLGGDRLTIANWRTATGKDVNSMDSDPRINNNTNLQIQPNSPLLLAGTPIAGITLDYQGTTRSATNPTIGAYETSVDVAGPDISYTPLPNSPSLSNVTTVNFATITDPNGVNGTSGTAPRIYYKKSNHNNTFADNTSSTNGWKWTEGALNVTFWDFTIDYSLLFGGTVTTGDVIQYFVVAQDNMPAPNVGIKSGVFNTIPSSVDLQASNFPITGTINSYSITSAAPLAGDYTVGLAMFNLITGKNLQPAEFVRKQKTENRETDKPISNYQLSINNLERKTEERGDRPEETRTDERYFALAENGVEYKGTLYAPYTKEFKKEHNLPDYLMGNYANITNAVNDLNNLGVSAPVRFLLLDANYGEPGTPETFPIRINQFAGGSSDNTVTLQPQTGISTVISGSSTVAIFDLFGADNFTIDGRRNGNPSGKDMTIRNTDRTNDTNSVVRFINDARNNKVQYCTIEGSSTTSPKSGLIFFSTTNLSSGNDSNYIQFN